MIKESNCIKTNYIKINTLIDILTWLVKNTNNKKLNIPPEKIKDETEYIVLKTCGVKRERWFYKHLIKNTSNLCT